MSLNTIKEIVSLLCVFAAFIVFPFQDFSWKKAIWSIILLVLAIIVALSTYIS